MLDLTPTWDRRIERVEKEKPTAAHLDPRSPLKQGLTIYQLCCESGFVRRRLGGAIELSLAEAAQHDINAINEMNTINFKHTINSINAINDFNAIDITQD